MTRVITYDGKLFIGAYKFVDRKKPCLCVKKGSSIVVYGTFNNDEAAEEFMKELGEFLGAEFEEGKNDEDKN